MKNGYTAKAQAVVDMINSGKEEYQYPTAEPFVTELLRGQLMAQIGIGKSLIALTILLQEKSTEADADRKKAHAAREVEIDIRKAHHVQQMKAMRELTSVLADIHVQLVSMDENG